MKKLLFILFASISIQVNALNLVIVNASFNSTDSICPNSPQWVDAIVQGSWSTSDILRVFIDGQTSNYQVLLNVNFSTYYFAQPINSDSSRRIYFTMPSNPQSAVFEISLNLGNQYWGVVSQNCTTTGIIESEKSVPILTDIVYYNLQGQKIIPNRPGLYIKMIGNKREKVYFTGY